MTAYERLLGALTEHGCRVIENGSRTARATCPAHDDTNPSLSVKAIDGRVLLYCHVCGREATPGIIAALGLTMGDLFDIRGGHDYRYPGGLIVRRYYPNTDGRKTFAQKGNKADRSLHGSDHITQGSRVYATRL